ncbi:MAG: transposase [Hymenobacter sp.]
MSTGAWTGASTLNGRKRQILTDVQGRILACRVHAANGHDGVEALALLPALPSWGQRLVTVVTDKGYRGRFARQLARLGLRHQLGSRPPSARGFRARGQALGRGAHLCLAHRLSPPGHRLRIYPPLARNLAAHCQHDHVPQSLNSGLIP